MDDLPLELIVHILQYLNKNEQIKFSRVNKKFHEAVLSPSLWTEYERMDVLSSHMKSFRKFLKKVPNLRCLNLLFVPINLVWNPRQLSLIDINFPSVLELEPLKNLEFLSLQLIQCKSRPSMVTYFPSSLKHIILIDYYGDGRPSFINDDLLKSLADSCPLLEYMEIESQIHDIFSRKALCYLLDKVKDTLQTLILSDHFNGKSVFDFIDCPPNVTTLCFQTFNHKRSFGKLINLQNLEILQILALDQEFPLSNEDFTEKKFSIPNLQILYLDACHPDVNVLMRFITCCPSLKVLAWNEPNGYSNEALSELEKLGKEKAVKVYLNFIADPNYCYKPVHNFPSCSNENFLCFETFYKVFSNKHHFITNFFKCGSVPH